MSGSQNVGARVTIATIALLIGIAIFSYGAAEASSEALRALFIVLALIMAIALAVGLVYRARRLRRRIDHKP